jgi:REP element-mobilizing transposase RayT
MSSVAHTVLSNIEIIDSKSFLPVQDDPLAGDSGVNQTLPDAGESGEKVILEPVEEHPYDLSYTCLLLPRFESHYLIGDIVPSLQTRLQKVCISFGWRLEFLSIQPDHMQWTMRVPPTASTAYFMQVIREQTSRHIFADFPRFKRENASDDFWAPGYLIVWGTQPHPTEIIQRYTRQTRQQQGLRPHD